MAKSFELDPKKASRSGTAKTLHPHAKCDLLVAVVVLRVLPEKVTLEA
jgi:hypothetical protein